jgi:sugar lactone lactonase YvrE
VGKTNSGEVWCIAPDGAKTLAANVDLSGNGMLTGVAVDRYDRVYVTTFDADPVGSGVYRIVSAGSPVKVIALPAGTFCNGLAIHDGLAYITDSTLGAVWRARVGSGVAAPAVPWLQDAVLAPSSPTGIGANGIAFRGGRLFVSVSDHGVIVRIPLRADGSPGAPRVICRRAELKTADGIACDARGGIWITTNAGRKGAKGPGGGLYHLSRAAGLQRIAASPGWLNYPVMAVFGTTPTSLATLFILNGAYYSYEDGTAPDVWALRVDVPGPTSR